MVDCLTEKENERYNRCMMMGGIFMTSWAQEIVRQAKIREQRETQGESRA